MSGHARPRERRRPRRLCLPVLSLTVPGFAALAAAGEPGQPRRVGPSVGAASGTLHRLVLIGGDIYTAHTFIAVPATLYAGSVVRVLHAVPTRSWSHPDLPVPPRLWSVSHRHGYVTPDFDAGPLRQPVRAGRGPDWDPRDDALHRAAASRHAGRPQVMGIGGATAGTSTTCRSSSFAVLAPTPQLRAPRLIAFVKDALDLTWSSWSPSSTSPPARRLGPCLRRSVRHLQPENIVMTPGEAVPEGTRWDWP